MWRFLSRLRRASDLRFSVATVLVRVVGPAVAHPVALGERPVEQCVLRCVLAQDLEQAGRPRGQEIDHRGRVGVGGADRDAEPGRYLPQALPAVLEHRRTTTGTNARASLERQECSPMPGTVTDAVLAVR